MKPVIKVKTKKSGEESLHYNLNDMEKGKLYEFIWYGEQWVAKKTHKGVDFEKRIRIIHD